MGPRVDLVPIILTVVILQCCVQFSEANKNSTNGGSKTYRTRASKSIEEKPIDSKNVVQVESKWSRPIIVPEFSENGDLTLIRFENATKKGKVQKKVKPAGANLTETLTAPLPAPIAAYMADIVKEIPKNTSKNDREKMIIENLFIEILKDDKLKDQLTEVISNVTKNTLEQTSIKIGDAETAILSLRNNKTRNSGKTESTNGKTESGNGKRNKGNVKNENAIKVETSTKTTDSTKPDAYTTAEFFPLRSRGKNTSEKLENKDEEEDNEDNKSTTESTNVRKKTKTQRQKTRDDDDDDRATTVRNETDEDNESVTINTNDIDITSTPPDTDSTTIVPTRTTTTKKIPPRDRNRVISKLRRKPIKTANLESLDERDSIYWYEQGDSALKGLLERRINEKKARNVILFLGDGMSLATVTAARIYDGQQNGHTGEEAQLSFESFPTTGLSKTYCIDKQVADSACTATAYLSGVKANYGTMGVSGLVTRNDCEAMRNESNHVDSIADWAQSCGKSTGLVTTTRVTHATPAALYAHTANRDWESDKHVLKAKLDPRECEDIASQLITRAPGNELNVILGGGRAHFLPDFVTDDEGHNGKRKDKRDLIDIWKQVKVKQGKSIAYVTNQTDLMKVNTSSTDYLLGLFSNDHLDYALDADLTKQPTLAEMTEVAVKMLDKNPEGFFLLVEGGRIDHAHHENMAHKALDETVEFSEAVRKASELVDLDETLIVVTADHSHTMTINGYPTRGNDILGLAGTSDVDNAAYTTLSYANGPSSKRKDIKRHDFSRDNLKYKDYKYPAMWAANSESHGGEDVPVFSTGPWSHLLSGVYQQNVIPRVMGFAACMGPGGYTACNTRK
uniref:Alkaline phosphatase n=1 Tax=Cacopsylla melanoneura TaxID=428564 RepID=A0A8D9BH38_9HEMI